MEKQKQKDYCLSTNRLAEKLEKSKTEMSGFLTSDDQTFKQMGNSNYCGQIMREKKKTVMRFWEERKIA